MLNQPGNRDTPVTFSPEEATQIRKLIMTEGARVECPRCKGELNMETIAGGGSIATVWELRCPQCRRSLIVKDLPKRPPGAD